MILSHIRLDEMHERHRGLTQAVAAAYEEAASVCLNRYHAPPVEITLSDNGTEMTAELSWVKRVGEIRNDVMHFHPDGVGSEDLHALRKFTRFLNDLEKKLV